MNQRPNYSGLRVDGTIPKLGGLYGPLYKRHLGVPVPSTLNPLYQTWSFATRVPGASRVPSRHAVHPRPSTRPLQIHLRDFQSKHHVSLVSFSPEALSVYGLEEPLFPPAFQWGVPTSTRWVEEVAAGNPNAVARSPRRHQRDRAVPERSQLQAAELKHRAQPAHLIATGLLGNLAQTWKRGCVVVRLKGTL